MPYDPSVASNNNSLDKEKYLSTDFCHTDGSNLGRTPTADLNEDLRGHQHEECLSDEVFQIRNEEENRVNDEENDDPGWTDYQGYSPLVSGPGSSFMGPYSIENPLDGRQGKSRNRHSIAEETDEDINEGIRRKEIEDEKKIARVMKMLEYQMKALDTDYNSCLASEKEKYVTKEANRECNHEKDENGENQNITSSANLNENIQVGSATKDLEVQSKESEIKTRKVSLDHESKAKLSSVSEKTKTKSLKKPLRECDSNSFPSLPGSIEIKTTCEPIPLTGKLDKHRLSKMKRRKAKQKNEISINLDTTRSDSNVTRIPVAPVSPLSQEKANQIKSIMKGIHISEKAIPFWAKEQARKNMKE